MASTDPLLYPGSTSYPPGSPYNPDHIPFPGAVPYPSVGPFPPVRPYPEATPDPSVSPYPGVSSYPNVSPYPGAIPPLREARQLDYALPAHIERAHKDWIKACDSSTIATSILTSVAVSVWIHLQEKLKDDSPSLPTHSWQSGTLLILAYMAVIANCSATITSFLIIDKFVEISPDAAKRMQDIGIHRNGSVSDLFKFYLGWKLWNPFKTYWIVSLILGVMCIFAEFLLYLWIWEPLMVVKVFVTVFAALGLSSFVAFFGEAAHKRITGKEGTGEMIVRSVRSEKSRRPTASQMEPREIYRTYTP